MKKTLLLTSILFLNLVLFSSCSMDKPKVSGRPMSLDMVDAHGVRDFYCNRTYVESLQTASWDYVSGLVAYSVLQTYQQYPYRHDLLEIVKAYADYNLSAYGDTIYKGHNYKNKKRILGVENSNLDDLSSARIFFGLYQEMVKEGNEAEAERYKKAATMCRNKLKYEHERIPDKYSERGGFIHKANYPFQMWLDGLFMGSPIYAMYENMFDDAEQDEINDSWHDIARQFLIVHEATFDDRFNLCYHAFTANPNDPNSFWAQKHGRFAKCSKEFWGRAMGWYFVALIDVLEIFPKDHPDFPKLLHNLEAIAKGIKDCQDPKHHLWYQLLVREEGFVSSPQGDKSLGVTYNNIPAKNYIEASASCLFTYGFYKAMRLGLLEKTDYVRTADLAYNAILSDILYYEGSHLSIGQICASAGLGPRRDAGRTGTANYYLAGRDVTIVSNEGKGIGPFILASLEREKFYNK